MSNGEPLRLIELSKQLHEGLNEKGYPYVFNIKERKKLDPKYSKAIRVNNAKSQELLGLDFALRSEKEFMVEMALSMIKQGMLPLPNKVGGVAKL